MSDIASDKAELVALWLETLLFGIYFSLFLQAFALTTYRRSQRRINWILIIVSIGIFIFASAHLLLVLARAIQAFITFRNAKGGPVGYFNNLQSALEVSQASSQVAISFLGDGMAIYRVWVVYSRNWWVMVLPLISLVGTTVASVASVIFIGQASSVDTPFYIPKLEKWMPIFFGLTFCTSVLCSLLIAGKLWYINHYFVSKFSATGVSSSRLRSILRIVVESASLYSATMLLYLVTYTEKTNYSIIFGDMVAPVIGIAFSLITIRVNNAFSPDHYESYQGRTAPTLSDIPGVSIANSASRSRRNRIDPRGAARQPQVDPTQVTINISQTTSSQSDGGSVMVTDEAHKEATDASIHEFTRSDVSKA